MQSPVGGEIHSQGFLQQSKTKIRLTQLSLQHQDKPRVTNSDEGFSFSKVHTLLGNHWSKRWLQYWDFFYMCSIRSFLQGEGAVCKAESHRKVTHWWGICSLLSCPPEYFALKAACPDSTAAVGQVQGSDGSAALGRTSLFKHSKTLDSGKTP